MSKRRYVILLRKVSKVCDGLVLGLDHSYVPGFVRSDTFNDSMMLRSDWLSTKKELKADPITSKMMDHLAVVNEYGTEVTLVSDLKKQKKQIKLPEKIIDALAFERISQGDVKLDFWELLNYIDVRQNNLGVVRDWLSVTDKNTQFKRIKLLYKAWKHPERVVVEDEK